MKKRRNLRTGHHFSVKIFRGPVAVYVNHNGMKMLVNITYKILVGKNMLIHPYAVGACRIIEMNQKVFFIRLIALNGSAKALPVNFIGSGGCLRQD
jgi:hypothetical protein